MITGDHAGSLRLVMDGFVLGVPDYDSGDPRFFASSGSWWTS
jgi:hypothetical protein